MAMRLYHHIADEFYALGRLDGWLD